MSDYSLLGSFSTGGASSLNADLITQLKEAETESVLFSVDDELEAITGLDADTGDALDTLGELDTLSLIKAQALTMMSTMSVFDLDSTSSTAFDSVSASTTGTAAVFDAVDVGGLEPGTTNITVEQLAQKDVYQSTVWTQDELDANFPIESDVDLATIKSSSLSVTIGDETFDFDIFKDLTVTTESELSSKTLTELAAEINENEKLTASVETVGTDEFRLVIKSTDSGLDNALKITQTNIDIGFDNDKYSSEDISDSSSLISNGQDVGDEITLNGVSFSTEGKSYDQLITDINNDASFSASLVDDKIVINTLDNSDLEISQTGVDLGFYNSTDSHIQMAQNLEANVDGVDYNISSNTLTIQGNLTMTAVEVGTATIDIQKDTTAIVTGVESMISNYNDLVTMVNAELYNSDSVMTDSSTLRSLLSSVKETLFESYGENGDLNLFNYGLELSSDGVLSLDTTTFGEALVDNYDDVKDLLMGNTASESLASEDSTKFLGLGTILQNYLDNLDSSTGILERYETSITAKQEELETEREEALESLDIKYTAMSEQFSLYSTAITELESSFSALSLMIDQSVSTSS